MTGRPLDDPRRERFAQLVAAGSGLGAAYGAVAAESGQELTVASARNGGSQWGADPAVKDRIEELRRAAAASAASLAPEVATMADAHAALAEVTASLGEAIEIAEKIGLPAAAIDRCRKALARHTGRVQHRSVRLAADRMSRAVTAPEVLRTAPGHTRLDRLREASLRAAGAVCACIGDPDHD